jgi:hypothetical protein
VSRFVGVVFVLAALTLGLSAQSAFDAEKQSEPPHVAPTVAWVAQDYPDALTASETARDEWITNEVRRREAERVAEDERVARSREVAGPPVARAGSGDAAACTRAHESDTAGGYAAYNPAGPYYGAYQFLQSTWDNVARAMGRGDLVGVRPSVASPADQDAAFWWLWDDGRGASHFGGRCL